MKKPTTPSPVERLSSVISLVHEANKKIILAAPDDVAEWEEIAEALDLATDDLRAAVLFVDAKLKAMA